MAEFPAAVPTFVNPTRFDNTIGVSNSGQHEQVNDEVVASSSLLLNRTVPSGGAKWRFKLVGGVLELHCKDESGGGTPWHKVYIGTGEGQYDLVVDQTGQA